MKTDEQIEMLQSDRTSALQLAEEQQRLAAEDAERAKEAAAQLLDLANQAAMITVIYEACSLPTFIAPSCITSCAVMSGLRLLEPQLRHSTLCFLQEEKEALLKELKATRSQLNAILGKESAMSNPDGTEDHRADFELQLQRARYAYAKQPSSTVEAAQVPSSPARAHQDGKDI